MLQGFLHGSRDALIVGRHTIAAQFDRLDDLRSNSEHSGLRHHAVIEELTYVVEELKTKYSG